MSKVMKVAPLLALCALITAVPSVWANWVQDGVALCTATGCQYNPQIVSDGAGGAIVTWFDYRNGSNWDLYAKRVNASGAVLWTADGVALCTATGDQGEPTITSDGAGGAIVTWSDNRGGNGRHIYAQKVDASGTVQWTTDGVPICTATGGQSTPTITSDGAGGAIVTWEDYRSGSNFDIYAQRMNASGVVQWAANGLALCTATGDQTNPTIISDGAGGAIVTWNDYRNGIDDDIYAQLVNASGAVQWNVNGVALCTAAGGQWHPTSVSDGAGGAIVTWFDLRNGNKDIYVQRANASGAVQWTADGVALCTATGSQWYPTITSDGAGGAIVTWEDNRSGSYDVYAQRANSSGAVQWTTDGVTLCTAAGDQQYPTIISDAVGGAIVTWEDNRSGSFADIYAQRVNASGAVQWTTDGVALCAATGDQWYPTTASDGAGGAIVTWEDLRGGDCFDIYAQRVDANGFAVLTGTETPAVRVELHQNYPNPFNPATTVTYCVPEKCNVTLEIYDISGMRVARLVNTQQEKGSYAVEWSGKDEKGNSVASGIYLCRLAAGNRTITKKMVLLR